MRSSKTSGARRCASELSETTRALAAAASDVVQAEREREMAEVVGRELQLHALRGQLPLGQQHAALLMSMWSGPLHLLTNVAIDAWSARSSLAT